MVDKDRPKERVLFNGVVRPLSSGDLDAIKPILETWVKNRNTGEPIFEEVEEDLQLMRDSLSGENGRKYLVAELSGGEVVGIIGFMTPNDKMLLFTKTARPVELVNAYVAKEHRGGRGVGTALVQKLEDEARKKGYTEVVLNSGPRYKDTAWVFYTRKYGEPVGIAKEYYGEDGDAPVWRKELY